MDRRDTLKTLFVGTLAGAALATTAGCTPDTKIDTPAVGTGDAVYGRTEAEKERDQRLMAEKYFTAHELETIAVLSDIILPSTATAVSASEAGVPEFIEFIVKDMESNKLPMRGGIGWLDIESNKRFNKQFQMCSNTQQIEIIEDIAYPDPDNKKPEMGPGIKFFDLMRNLTLTGYYTSKLGIRDLGYKGNTPNVWDGVPADVLAEHDVDYDPEWIAKCVDQSKRDVIAAWDDDGNLIS
ncbi:gluconate 2-dehydrogenase subunit 3 family protein [Portibacter lacus]|uniref:Transcriptional initiation protein Tat n=1 Tax=Portibacter lacus TaxID=1099794 RepID=A0AA37WFH7_9BACT|nr:gluconate 2-dehydrogenase subunit 3 family protein [Portibacter lacus]GLR19991.1 transcriptional initiation protein Tat [Portibacter lacus]